MEKLVLFTKYSDAAAENLENYWVIFIRKHPERIKKFGKTGNKILINYLHGISETFALEDGKYLDSLLTQNTEHEREYK